MREEVRRTIDDDEERMQRKKKKWGRETSSGSREKGPDFVCERKVTWKMHVLRRSSVNQQHPPESCDRASIDERTVLQDEREREFSPLSLSLSLSLNAKLKIMIGRMLSFTPSPSHYQKGPLSGRTSDQVQAGRTQT